jgi:hypothetical protein
MVMILVYKKIADLTKLVHNLNAKNENYEDTIRQLQCEREIENRRLTVEYKNETSSLRKELNDQSLKIELMTARQEHLRSQHESAMERKLKQCEGEMQKVTDSYARSMEAKDAETTSMVYRLSKRCDEIKEKVEYTKNIIEKDINEIDKVKHTHVNRMESKQNDMVKEFGKLRSSHTSAIEMIKTTVDIAQRKVVSDNDDSIRIMIDNIINATKEDYAWSMKQTKEYVLQLVESFNNRNVKDHFELTRVRTLLNDTRDIIASKDNEIVKLQTCLVEVRESAALETNDANIYINKLNKTLLDKDTALQEALSSFYRVETEVNTNQ